MDRKVVYSVVLAIAITVLLVYVFVIRKTTESAATSTTTNTTTVTITQPSGQPFVVKEYTINQAGNILIPLMSEDFVISVKPINGQASISMWFNIEDDVKQHDDSLIVNNSPVTITQETPVLYSSTLKQNGVPYEGYPYLVIATNAPILVKASFYAGGE